MSQPSSTLFSLLIFQSLLSVSLLVFDLQPYNTRLMEFTFAIQQFMGLPIPDSYSFIRKSCEGVFKLFTDLHFKFCLFIWMVIYFVFIQGVKNFITKRKRSVHTLCSDLVGVLCIEQEIWAATHLYSSCSLCLHNILGRGFVKLLLMEVDNNEDTVY